MSARWTGVMIVAATMAVSGCAPRETAEERHREANTPAGKAGQAAHAIAVEANKAGKVIGRQLDKAAHDAREGWKEAARKDSNK